MKKFKLNKISLFFALSLIFLIGSFAFGFINIAQAAKGVPLIMSYQGRLMDAGGNLLGSSSGTTYYFKFSIWDVATGGTAPPNRLWPTGAPGTATSSVRQGVFNVNIGDVASGYPDVLDYNFNTNKDIYLQVEVSSTLGGTYEALSPRQRISSAPFAQVSGAVSGIGQSSFGTTTPDSNAVVTIEATSTSAIPMMIRAFAGQLANLFQIQNSTGTSLFVVDNSGNVGVGTSIPSRKFNVWDVNSVPQLRFSQSSSTYGELYADLAGDITIKSSGGNVRNQDENLWVCSGACDVTGKPSGTGNTGNIILENALFFNNNFKFAQTGAAEVTMFASSTSSIAPVLIFDDLNN